MSEPVRRILTALREHGHEPKRAGNGWTCRCPAHDDRTPSLSIHAGDDGRALVNCHAGCTVDAVCGAIGLRSADLFIPDPSRLGRNGHAPPHPKTRRRGDGDETTSKLARGGDSVTVASDATGGRTFPTARDAVADLERRHGPRSTTWTYHNAAGEPVGLVVRWNTPMGKDVRPVSRKADGSGWCIGGIPTPRPLYALPDLLATPAAARVFIVEGEKAADSARAVGLVATTSPHGSKSASKADWSPMAGRDVVILPDHDDAGERYATDVARLLTAAGAKSVRVIRLVDLWAGMPEGGDMADLVKHRGGDVEPIRAEVETLADKTELEAMTPDAPAVPVFKPFPVDVLPEPIHGFVLGAAKAMGCDPSFVALPLLAGLAAAIGNTHRLRLSNTWHAPPNLWTVTVGESGSLKSPAFRLAMKPIRKTQAKAWKEHEAAHREWEAEHLRYEAELTGWKRDAAKKHGDDGYTIAPPEKPAPPIARRYTVSDTTVEALAPILLENPSGVLLARDELNGWLGSFDQYRGGRGADSAHWLSMHDGEEMTVDRKTGNPRTIRVPLASVSITGGIQPGVLARAMGQEHHESGMLARLLFAMPPRKAKRWTEADVDPASEAAVAVVFDRLYALTPATDGEGDAIPRLLTLTPDGKAAWVLFYNEHNTEAEELTGDEAAAWSKLEGYAPRLALVVHLTRAAAGDTTLLDPSRVNEASIMAGVVLARWFGDEARRVYAILGESDEGRESRRLVEWIDRKGGTATVRELTRGPREYRGDPERATKALGELVAAGVAMWVHDDHGPKGGRPTDRIRLVSRRGDTGDGDETPVNAGNRVGSVTVATVAKPTDAGDGWGEL